MSRQRQRGKRCWTNWREGVNALIVVNNAGVTKDNLLMRMPDAEWNEVIETNLSGAFRVTKPMLRAC